MTDRSEDIARRASDSRFRSHRAALIEALCSLPGPRSVPEPLANADGAAALAAALWAVIILHERGNRGRRAVQVLRRVLPVLSSRGHRVVAISELGPLVRSAGMPAASLETGKVSDANGARCAGIPVPFSLG